MAKLEESMEDPRKQQSTKKKIKPNKFFVFIDYLFLLLFFSFLCFILFKILATI